MSRVIDLCEDSDDNGEWPNTASVPSLPLSRKRPRDKEELSNDASLSRNENGPGNNTATGSAEFVVDLELADKVEVSPHRKRRGDVKCQRTAKNVAAGKCAQILKGVVATEKDVGSEDAQRADHRESHEGIAVAASHPINSDSEQKSRDDGSANKHSQKLSTSKPPSNASGRECTVSWEGHLSQLADYRKIHGHCNVPTRCSENTRLANWVKTQKINYLLHLERKKTYMTLSRIQELESLGFEWDRRGASWEDRLSELADYHKIHGHCNVPKKYSENTKLGQWVTTQRSNYRWYQEGKTSPMTTFRIKGLESLGFEWGVCVTHTAWEDRLRELADYRKIHGHCNVPCNYSENTELANWVKRQRSNYRLHLEGKKSSMTTFRIQELESLGFEWDSRAHFSAWEDRLSELADYRKIHGHCNVSKYISGNSKLGEWVAKQRSQYRMHLKGKTSPMTTFRIQELESLGFEWGSHLTAWEDRLSELADYHKIHGHCNVPTNYRENTQLGWWVNTQKKQYRLHVKGKKSFMTLSRIQALESLGFEWKPSIFRGKGTPKKPSPDGNATRVRKTAVQSPEHMQQHSLKKLSAVEKAAAIKSTSLWSPKNQTGMAKSASTSSKVEPKQNKRVEAGDARFDETDLDGSPSELAAKPSLYRDKSAPVGDSVESNTRKDVLQAKLPRLPHQKKIIHSFSDALFDAGSPENDFLVAAKKPMDSRQGAESQPEPAPSDEMFRANPVAAEPLLQSHNLFTHALLLGDGSTGNGVQATPDKHAKHPQDMQQTPQYEVCQTDNVLNEVELELLWLGEESMYCLSCLEFQFDFIYEYASPVLKVELRKLSRDDQSETERLNQIVRMEDWLVSQRFDFVRNYIRNMLVRGFRRQRMGTVIAELRLLRRRQLKSERHFPALILDP
jgi:hypothetical protein